MLRSIALLIGLLCLPTPAWAEWYEATSDHFVIYADDREKDVREFAENLERYHSALNYLNNQAGEKPTPSNRVTIFVVGKQRDIRELAGTDNRNIAGFYIPRAGGSKAFVQDIRFTNGQPDFSLIVLLHEYAHHYFIANSSFAMPRWQSEGSAEFFASAMFGKDGSVSVGRIAYHRFGELRFADEVTLEELLDHELYERNKSKKYDSFYGRSWLLYHHLVFSPARTGQLRQYQLNIRNGMSSPDAARAAFGDLKQLERDLEIYQKQRSWTVFKLDPDKITTGPITLRALSEGEAAMMPVRIRSQRGVNAEQAAEVLIDARKVAALFPDDPGVLTALAEAEFDAGNDAAAIIAADKAIAADPARKNAYVQKGYALFRMAENADDQEAAFKQAMVPFTTLNKLENDHPLPLIYYYRSYAQRSIEPPVQAKRALIRASELAPFDKGLRFQAAMLHALDGRISVARSSLKSLANDPHGGRGAQIASRMLAALDKSEEGKPFRPPLLIETADIAADGGDDDRGDGSVD